jgi:hypothetical protein
VAAAFTVDLEHLLAPSSLVYYDVLVPGTIGGAVIFTHPVSFSMENY